MPNIKCVNCEKIVIGGEYLITHDGDMVCYDCEYDGVVQYCECCDELFFDDELNHVGNDETVCDSCMNEYYTECDNCNHIGHDEDMHFDRNGECLCDNCREDYIQCYACEVFVHVENSIYNDAHGDWYCYDCAPSSIIHDYNYSPALQFFGNAEGKDYYGVELEVDLGDDYNNHEDVASSLEGWTSGELYFKEDGSLNDGFEIISQPCSFEHHMNNINWKGMLNDLRNEGYRSHDVGTCGIHVHISRKGFGQTFDEQDLNIMKLLFIVERHWDKMVAFSRRTERQLDSWAKSYVADSGMSREVICERELLETAKCAGRYYAINLNNRSTVEFRLFRGTLNINTFKATIQFVKALRDLVIDYSIEELQTMSWNGVARYLERQGYEELNRYLKQRGIEYKDVSTLSYESDRETA
ncbi:hypothetical protein DCC39_18235 [Pueribacillus theae]|uniref:Zinc-binding protein n=1 Tax=Pueribacillus theae TaxID=2171751 RepID=A0A2U1JJF9_9BACI|nr:amidoligase family protein [Pueribacillus theae]PWA05271.1 hypothetical protein DCC39_18235 [Pueribacillus theae]